jgi:hypothetical protein
MDRLGIDTNVLVRLWANDDPVQVARIRARLAPLEEQAESVLINDITLCESVWVVGSAYRADKAGILAAAGPVGRADVCLRRPGHAASCHAIVLVRQSRLCGLPDPGPEPPTGLHSNADIRQGAGAPRRHRMAGRRERLISLDLTMALCDHTDLKNVDQRILLAGTYPG